MCSTTTAWARLLGLGAAVVEAVNVGEEGGVVFSARPRRLGEQRYQEGELVSADGA